MTDAKKNTRRSDRNKTIIVIATTGLLIGASFGVQAIAESRPFQHAKLYFSQTGETDTANPFLHKAGWGRKHHRDGGYGPGRFSEMSDAEIEKKISRLVKHVSIEIDATPEQEKKITALLTVVAKDMKPLHGQFHAAGKEMQALLTAPTIDRIAMEKIRADRMAQTDQLSKELVNAAADVAEVLTPEQRKTLQKRVEQFRSMRHRWRRG